MDIPESVVAAAEYVASWASENSRGDSWEIGRCASRHELIRLRAENGSLHGLIGQFDLHRRTLRAEVERWKQVAEDAAAASTRAEACAIVEAAIAAKGA